MGFIYVCLFAFKLVEIMYNITNHGAIFKYNMFKLEFPADYSAS